MALNLTPGDVIYSSVSGKSYSITWVSDKIANAEVGFALASGSDYFIKRHLNPHYPTDDAKLSPSMKEAKRKYCNDMYCKNSATFESVRKGCGEGGACVPILDYFREGPFYYTVYRKINADSLSLNEISSLPAKEKYKLLLRLVQGLMPLHALGVIHGDLKPDNILVQREGEDWRIRLIDIDDCYKAGEPKEPGAVLGTIDYYSPELATYNIYEVEDWNDPDEMALVQRMAKDLTLKSDIFALGIIFSEFFGGERPVSTDERIQAIHEAAVRGCIELPPSVTCDSKISALIRKMLDSNYKARPTLSQVGDDLRKILQNKLVAPEIEFEALDDEGMLFNCIINTYSDGDVCYTTDGSTPTLGSTKYTSPIKVAKHTTVKALVTDGRRKTEVVSKQAWLMRSHTLAPKIIVKGKEVTIRLNDRSSITTQVFYTLDGSIPTKDSEHYTGLFTAPSGVSKIRAIAIEPKAIASPIVEANVYKLKVQKPIMHYKSGVVSIESPQGLNIYYTLDDTSPTKESLRYIEPFKLADTSKFQVKAVCIDDESSVSEIAEIRRPNKIVMSVKK